MLYFILMDLDQERESRSHDPRDCLFTEWISQAWKLVVGQKKRRRLMGEISEFCWDDP